MANFSIDSQAQDALSHLQDTTLSPMNEALFQAWAKANKIKEPDAPKDHVDYRGIFEMTGGKILPNGQLNRFASKLNSEDKLRKILQDQAVKHMQETVQSAQDRHDMFHKEERQDITHQQKMEMEAMKQQNQPHEQAMEQMALQKQQGDLKKQQMGLQSQHLGNRAKELDITKAVVAPQQPTVNKEKTNAGTV